MMRILWLIFMFSCCFWGTLLAQEHDSISRPERLTFDSSSDLHPVHFNPHQLQQYRDSKDFDYSDHSENLSWWGRFVQWINYAWNAFWKNIGHKLNGLGGSWASFLISILKYGVILGILVLIVYLFIRLNPGKAILKNQYSPKVQLSEEEEIIRQKDIPSLIEEALTHQDYRLAVRYDYLLILKKLSDQNLIDYQYDKTNTEYRKEINAPELEEKFAHLSRLYDFIWYGNFSVNRKQYTQAEVEFKSMQTQLNDQIHVKDL